MKFAILGVDAATLDIGRAIAESAEHELAWISEENPADPLAGELRRLAVHARIAETWEAFLDRTLVDAVVLASGNEDVRAEQLRKFVQVEIPLLVSHPVLDSMVVYFEIDMIRRETGSVLVPYLPDRWHPAVVRLAEAVGRGGQDAIGRVEQVVFERQMASRSRRAVRWQFARDVDTLRAVCGDIVRLGAMGGLADGAAAGLGVQMSGPDELLVRWSVAPAESGTLGRLTLFGADGRMELAMHEAAPWSLTTSGQGQTDTKTYDAWQPARAALARFETAASGENVEPAWPDAARSIELMETIDRSLKRGRTIDLHYEDYSEQGTFKGLMAALGCGLLILGLILLMVIALAEDVARALKLRVPLIEWWPVVLAAVLGLFLSLQLFTLLFKADRRARDELDR